MRILLTRPREDAEALAATLRGRGHTVTIEPLFVVHPVDDGPLDLSGVQAVLLTSANGARALAQRTTRRDLGVLAVGDATAAAARALGFDAVESASGDVDDLARLVQARLRPEGGVLLHAAGSVVAGDLSGQLTQAGFIVRRTVLYRAKPVDALSPDVAAALRAREFDMVVFFSPRNAAVFVKLASESGLSDSCAHAVALGLSPAVVGAAEGLNWGARHAAEQPNETALIAAIDRIALSYAPPEMTTPTIIPPAPDRAPPEPASGPWTAPPPTHGAAPPPHEPPGPLPPEALPPPPAARPRAVGGAYAVAVIALLVAGASLGWTLWQNYIVNQASGQIAGRITVPAIPVDLAPRLAAIERQIAALPSPRADSAPDPRVAAVGERLAGIERRLGEIAAAPAASVTPDQLSALQRRIQTLESAPAPNVDTSKIAELAAEATRLREDLARLQDEVGALSLVVGDLMKADRAAAKRNDALLLAVGQLREAMARGSSFAPELASLQALASNEPSFAPTINSLAAHAARGVKTRAQLRDEFARMAPAILRNAGGDTTTSWWQAPIDRLSNLVSVRKIGDVAGDTPDAIAARAEYRLSEDDLAGAVSAVERLSGAPAEAARPWLTDARVRLDAERAVAALSAQALKAGAYAP
jgi:uroporphyrinogen-III synthase